MTDANPDPVTVTVDGHRITTDAGRTVAAVLMIAQERLGWRKTRFQNEERGLFCGIGVCFDCLVSVDGEPSMRACLIRVAEGMIIETEAADG